MISNLRNALARGRVLEKTGRRIVFHPPGTTYQMHLDLVDDVNVPMDTPIAGTIRVRARKVWTVPSGGLFIAPIFGPPKTIQGRIRELDERKMIVNAGTTVLIELSPSESAFDLANGPLEVGRMVNVTALPGAMFEPAMEISSESRTNSISR